MTNKGDTSVPVLTSRDLVKAHGRTRALRGASAGLHAGEILAVRGPGGSGSTSCAVPTSAV
ncbi:hypothetical protein ACFV2N_33915 [Streptomyces sp. NPDC059680]|uniref:hypothetical protein n=1 Tax=Streptomyces TaxID=1883 RepID=UPI0027E217F5|nr:hypothetical protein [Streptomyces barringtoniae]